MLCISAHTGNYVYQCILNGSQDGNIGSSSLASYSPVALVNVARSDLIVS